MQTLLQDIRFGLRMLRKNPGFAIVAVLTLALGIGANTAIFSLLDQVMLHLLPVSKPEQLVVLRSPGLKRGRVWSDGDDSEIFSFPMYKALRENNTVFSGLLACFPTSVSVAFNGQTERTNAELVSGNFFEVLGVQPALGRLFTLADDRVPGGHPVVVLSYGYWMGRLGANPSVLNQAILVNAQPMTVVGVAPRGFNGVQPGQVPNLYVPMMEKAAVTPNWDGLSEWNDSWLAVIGRLNPGIPRRTAEASLDVTYQPLLAQQVQTLKRLNPDERQRFLSKKILLDFGGRGRTVLQRDAGTPLIALFVMVAVVLLIACANIANLLLAQGAARQRELAIRMALGASRWRMTRQLLVENLTCAFLGGFLALMVAVWTLNTLVSWISTGAEVQGLSAEMNFRLFGFAFLLTVLAGVIFGFIPSLRTTRTDPNSTLKDQGSSISAGRAHVRFRKGLVVAQTALTMLLLTGAGLFTRTLWNLRHVDLGMKADHLLTFSLAPALSGYSPQRAAILAERLRTELGSTPAVESVGSASIAALTGTDQSSNVTVPGAESLAEDELNVNQDWVSPRYFSTMGIPLVAGREFSESDGPQSPKVAIINEAMERRFFKGRDPLGSRFAFGGSNVKPDIEIVGVVKDAKNAEVREKSKAFAYLPSSQDPNLGSLTFYVRTAEDPLALATAIRKKVQQLDPNLPIFELKTVENVIDQNLVAERLVALLATIFGIVAASLAAIGIYGVLAYVVTMRMREIGIRMALGAASKDVRRMILGQGLVPVAVGMVIGAILALILTRGLASLLYNIAPTDPATFLAVGLLLGTAALIAIYFPARRATKVDPLVALRYE